MLPDPPPWRTVTRVHLQPLAAAIIAAAVLTACGADGPAGADPDGQVPAPEGTDFTTGQFDDIRLPRGAEEISEKTERDGAIAQSFAVSTTSPSTIMDFFSTSLPEDGWTSVSTPESTGTDSIAGAWVREGRRLEVSAVLAQGLEDERTQFSLVLLPTTADGSSIEGA